MIEPLGHEKLHVYRTAVHFVAWSQPLIDAMSSPPVAADHWDRAAESVVENIAAGNARRSRTDRNRFFDTAHGSALECAACLDICHLRAGLDADRKGEGKRRLLEVVRMLVGLRRARSPAIHEEGTPYAGPPAPGPVAFDHERLDVYQVSLSLISWINGFCQPGSCLGRHARHLDKSSTGILLNIAEGNGRFAELDHRRFIDLAHTAALQTATALDIMQAKNLAAERSLVEPRLLLRRIVPMLLGMKGYLDGKTL